MACPCHPTQCNPPCLLTSHHNTYSSLPGLDIMGQRYSCPHLAVPSALALTKLLPVVLNATSSTSSVWPVLTDRQRPLRTSHSRADASMDPLRTKLPAQQHTGRSVRSASSRQDHRCPRQGRLRTPTSRHGTLGHTGLGLPERQLTVHADNKLQVAACQAALQVGVSSAYCRLLQDFICKSQ